MRKQGCVKPSAGCLWSEELWESWMCWIRLFWEPSRYQCKVTRLSFFVGESPEKLATKEVWFKFLQLKLNTLTCLHSFDWLWPSCLDLQSTGTCLLSDIWHDICTGLQAFLYANKSLCNYIIVAYNSTWCILEVGGIQNHCYRYGGPFFFLHFPLIWMRPPSSKTYKQQRPPYLYFELC